MEVLFQTFIELGLPLLVLCVAFFTGRAIEKHHYREIRKHEIRWRGLPAVTFRSVPKSWDVQEAGLVTGNVVVSVDHFKRFLAGLRMLVGGRVKSYETLLDRARREALLRLKANAIEKGYGAIVNVRLETSRLASSRRKGKATAGVEVLAFGTGLKLRRAA